MARLMHVYNSMFHDFGSLESQKACCNLNIFIYCTTFVAIQSFRSYLFTHGFVDPLLSFPILLNDHLSTRLDEPHRPNDRPDIDQVTVR